MVHVTQAVVYERRQTNKNTNHRIRNPARHGTGCCADIRLLRAQLHVFRICHDQLNASPRGGMQAGAGEPTIKQLNATDKSDRPPGRGDWRGLLRHLPSASKVCPTPPPPPPRHPVI
ncbi:hypothetical protein J6590_001560 [Homalodisca vitripennis]|nr:hypothetical protein J6590_001560 [Homalodisca vitripennis]